MNPFLSTALRTLLAVAAACALTPAGAGTFVRMQTTQGAIDVALLDASAPITVANFLAYVRAGDYSYAMVHRSAKLQNGSPFVIQGGGYRWLPNQANSSIPSRGQIPDEYSAARPNARGTLSMAKAGPNTATSQWFVNMTDNSALLSASNNGGYSVFANITVPGMVIADRIAALQVVNAGSPFNELPVFNYAGGGVTRSNTVLVTAAVELPAQTTHDRIFNYLEATFPQYVPNVTGSSGEALGYTFRYYSGAEAYVGVKDDNVWYYLPAVHSGPQHFGSVASVLAAAEAAGY